MEYALLQIHTGQWVAVSGAILVDIVRLAEVEPEAYEQVYKKAVAHMEDIEFCRLPIPLCAQE
jgi:hypothetical protein